MSPSELACALAERMSAWGDTSLTRLGDRSAHRPTPLPPLSLPPISTYEPGLPTRRAGPLGVSAFDLKPYQEGDELRHLDLKRYMKTRALLVRRFEEERAGHLLIILDGSASMATPPGTWERALLLLQMITEACVRGGSSTTWLIERAGALTESVTIRSVQDVMTQLRALRRSSPEGGRPKGETLKQRVKRAPVGSACLYLTDLLGADVALPSSVADRRVMIQGRFPTPRGCRWSLCLRLAHPELWETVGRVTDPERGGSVTLPSDPKGLTALQAKLTAHLNAWAEGLVACSGPALHSVTWPQRERSSAT